MKKIMIIGAGPLQLPAIKKAKEMGLHVVTVDMDPEAVGFSYADEPLVINTIDVPAVVEAAKRIKVDGVLTLCTDLPVRTVAAVGEALNIPAISVENAFKATDKISMRETLKAAGVPVPYFFKAKNEAEFMKAVQEVRDLGYKCIIKPADNSGSRGVDLLSKYDEASLKEAYEYCKSFSHSGEVVVEEFMEGPEVCVETLSVNGEVYPIQITDKLTTGAPYFVEMGHSQPSQHPIEVQEDIRRVAIACNKALGNFNGASCTEIKATKDGAKVVEMGARLAGDFMTTDLVPLSCGVSMVESIIKIALGEKPDHEHKFEKASAIRFLKADEGTIKSISGIEEAEKIPGVIRIGLDRHVGDKPEIDVEIVKAKSPKEVAEKCETMASATIILRDPLCAVKDEWISKGQTILPLDMNTYFDLKTQYGCDKYIVDSIEEHQSFAEGGYFPADKGLPKVYCETGEILAGLKPGRERDDEIIVCSNIGMGLNDIAVGQYIMDKALEEGYGLRIPL